MTKPETSKRKRKEEPEKIKIITEESEENPSEDVRVFLSEFADENTSEDEEDHLKSENDEPKPKKSKRNKEENMSRKSYIPKYRKEWETKAEFKSWLSESIHGNTYFYCKFCKKDYRCGYSDITKHLASNKHKVKAALPAFEAQQFKFRGLLCPVFTPFMNTKKRVPEVNCKAIKDYANFLSSCNVKGILINDLLGEGMSLTIKERIEVTEIWCDICRQHNQFLMVQIGGAPLKDVIELAKHASRKEVGAVVLLPDLYSRPKNHLDVIKYIKLVSEYTGKIPILYHHNPEYTNIQINPSSLLLDIIGEVDSFVGLICTTNDIQQSITALNVNRTKFTVFMGTDEGILAAVASGFTCIMSKSLNFLPTLIESICESVHEGKVKVAQTSQTLLIKTLEALMREGDDVAVFKAATQIITNQCGITTREPLQSLWEGTVKKLHEKLKELGVV